MDCGSTGLDTSAKELRHLCGRHRHRSCSESWPSGGDRLLSLWRVAGPPPLAGAAPSPSARAGRPALERQRFGIRCQTEIFSTDEGLRSPERRTLLGPRNGREAEGAGGVEPPTHQCPVPGALHYPRSTPVSASGEGSSFTTMLAGTARGVFGIPAAPHGRRDSLRTHPPGRKMATQCLSTAFSERLLAFMLHVLSYASRGRANRCLPCSLSICGITMLRVSRAPEWPNGLRSRLSATPAMTT